MMGWPSALESRICRADAQPPKRKHPIHAQGLSERGITVLPGISNAAAAISS